ncbi:hypothetical protein I6M64_10760 [Acinetobacter lactucae]|uniref:DNA-binding protein n=1 Tax=Acinetobacter lactucae TaxID=1785128 RepID=A0ABS1AKM3_9GAMM|nr:hypothetical protein [Acinetobacter lactucae]MBJ8437799.1 hypothetical protein [Acinetobacter lactucae]
MPSQKIDIKHLYLIKIYRDIYMLDIYDIDNFLIQKETVIPFKSCHYFYEKRIVCTNSLIDMCFQINTITNNNDELKKSPEFLFASSVLAVMTKDYSMQRENSIKLLFKKDEAIPFLLLNLINHISVFFKVKDNINEIIKPIDNVEIEAAHPYFKFISYLLNIDSNKKIDTYVNAFKKIYGNYNNQEVLLYFYEYFHEIIKSKTRNLEGFTQFVFDNVDKDRITQTIWFFLSLYNLSRNDSKAIEYAKIFIYSDNLANTYAYNNALYSNTLRAAIRASAWDDFFYFKSIISDKPISSSQDFLKIFEDGEAKYLKERERLDHPLHPQNIQKIELEAISTDDLILLASVILNSGEDWGVLLNESRIKYIFPSQELVYRILKKLILKDCLKVSLKDFNKIDDDELYDFNKLINNNRFHLNINGIVDSKVISLSLIKQEIINRNDVKESILSVWKMINIGYFYSTYEYYLAKVSDSWVDEFELNQNVIERIETIQSTARRFSFTAYSAISATVSFHELQSTGNRHTQNTLLYNINKYLDFIEKGEADYSKPRFYKAPVLTIETLLHELFNLSPETIYNENISIDQLSLE